MLAPVELSGAILTPTASDSGATRGVSQAIRQAPTTSSSVRSAQPGDPQFLTVEPDGRDDVTFMDRLRHALKTVFEAVQRPDEAAAAAERAVQAAQRAIDQASGSEGFLVQLRVVGVDVAYSENGADGEAAYASYRRLGVEIGVASAGAVRAENTAVVGLDGRSFGLTQAETRTGLTSGRYRRVDDGGGEASVSAQDRLSAAQSGLARVKAMQDALKAYRSGDVDPLKRLLVDGDSPAGGRYGAVFPGTGAIALN